MSELTRAIDQRLKSFQPQEVPPFRAIRGRAHRRRQVRAAVAGGLAVAVAAGVVVALVPPLRTADDVLPYAPPAPTEAPAEDADDRTLTARELQQALLTDADLPEGYTLRSEPDTVPGAGCYARFAALEQPQAAAATARAYFEKGFGSRLTQTLASYRDTASAQEPFASVDALLSECSTFTGENPDGSTTSFQVQALPADDLGDQSVAIEVTGRAPSADVAIDIQLVRVGNTVMSIAQGGFITDSRALTQAAERGVARLELATKD